MLPMLWPRTRCWSKEKQSILFLPAGRESNEKERYKICRDPEEAPEGADLEEDREEAALAAVPAAASEEDLVEADLAEALEALIARPIITIIIITTVVGGSLALATITVAAEVVWAAFWVCSCSPSSCW